MADSVNTSLGVHLFENLQALNVGSTLFRHLWVLYRLFHPIGLNLHALHFPQYLFFFSRFLSNSTCRRAFHLCLSLSICLSRSYACLLVGGRLNVTVGKSCTAVLCSRPQDTHRPHYFSVFRQGLFKRSNVGQARKEEKSVQSWRCDEFS